MCERVVVYDMMFLLFSFLLQVDFRTRFYSSDHMIDDMKE